MKKLIVLILLIFSTCVFADFTPQDARVIGIIAQGSVIQGPFILYIGDSTVAGFPYRTPCGAKLVNGGVSGTGIRWWKANLPTILGAIKPKMVIVGNLVNDTMAPVDIGLKAEWQNDYLAIVMMISNAGAIPAFLTILPVEQNKPLGAGYFDVSAIQYYNNVGPRFASSAWALPLVDVWNEYSQGGYMPSGNTLDGVHPTSGFYTFLQNDIINIIQQGYWFTGHTCTDR
jgi:lysophospholipase L1-like esterase